MSHVPKIIFYKNSSGGLMVFVTHSLAEIAREVDGKLIGDAKATISGVASLEEAEQGELSFLANDSYVKLLPQVKATAVIVGKSVSNAPCSLIQVDNPDLAFARAVSFLTPPRPALPRGIHATAVIADSAKIGSEVSIGPCVVIDEGAIIGEQVQLWPGVYVGHNTVIGKASCLWANVTVSHDCVLGKRVIVHSGTVIGSDGFGFVWDGKQYVKVEQVGNVVIEDDVEIGANTAIDRARFGSTLIGFGSKLDNLIQIAHNVQIGKKCAFAAQVGIAGSATIGAGTVMGGRVGIVGHLDIAPGTKFSAMAGVTKSVGPGQFTGYPAREHKHVLDEWRNIKTIGRLRKKIKEFDRRLEKLETQTKNNS